MSSQFCITSCQWIVHDGEEDEDDIDSTKSDEETVKEGGDLYSWDHYDWQNITKKAKNSQECLKI